MSLAVATLLLLGSLLAVGSPVKGEEENGMPSYGGTLVEGYLIEPKDLWLPMSSQNPARLMIHVYSGLIAMNHNLEPIPDLAYNWEISDDMLTYTFHLFDNVTWHDGVKFTSADVKFSYEKILKPYHPEVSTYWTDFAELDRVDTPDDYTAVLHFKKKWAPALIYMTVTHSTISPKHILENLTVDEMKDPIKNPVYNKPIGTGPFKFVEWVRGSHIALERNPNYHRTDSHGNRLPYLDRYVVKFIPEPASLILALVKGEIDCVFTDFPIEYTDWAEAISGMKVQIGGDVWSYVTRLRCNLREGPLSNKKVRQAISYAIDREEILDKAQMGLGEPVSGPYGPIGSWAYNPDIGGTYYYDPDKANALLDEAGYPRGADGKRFKIEILIKIGRPDEKAIAELTRDWLEDVGIEVEIKIQDFASFIDLLYVRWEFDIAIERQGAGITPDYYAKFYTSDQIVRIGWRNAMGYNNSRIDELFQQGRETLDREEHKEIYGEIQEILVEDLPDIYIYESMLIFAWKEEYTGYLLGTDEPGMPRCLLNGMFQSLAEVWWTGSPGTEVPTSPGVPVTYLAAPTVVAIIALVIAVYAVIKKPS